MRLLEHFDGREQERDISIVKNKSNFVPPMPNDQYLSLFLESISNLHETNEHVNQKRQSNITSTERSALKTLKEDDTIIIKPADKGGATVIMDKAYYKNKILQLLEDQETYIELAENEDSQTMKKIRKLAKSHNDELTEKEIGYIQNFTSKTSNFYGLPKVHKSSKIKAAIKEQNSSYIKLAAPEDLTFRPIVAGPVSPTHRLSNLIDIILKPLCKNVPSYIRDDLDFLSVIPEEISENTILVSFDVVSLYTSIPHELGLEAAKYWIENYGQSLTRTFSTKFILEAISIILKENTFCFDNKHYKQIQGTAMGTKMAPTYATLVMGYLERKLYENYETKYGQDGKEEFMKLFKRFLDDCFLPWEKSEEELKQLHNTLNNLHPKIQFTMEHNREKLPFLDILLFKNGNKLSTDIYYKPTDTHQYLNFKSCHPKHVKNNIPYCLARRICTIVIEKELREKRLEELKVLLHKQNYPENLITAGIEKAKRHSIQELRSPKNDMDNDERTLTIVTTHNPNNPQISNKIKENLKILNNSQKMKNILDRTKIIISRRQPKNLKQHLTKANFSTKQEHPTVTKCDELRCGTCTYILTGSTMTLKNGKQWTVTTTMNCKAQNVIYIIICTKCQSFYIGQTENLRKRVTLHKEQIKHAEYRHLNVSKHLHSCNEGKFQIKPIYQCSTSNRLFRESKESEIIKLLQPDLNSS